MRCSVGRKSPKVRDHARLSTFPFLAAQRTCARWGRHTVLMIEFEGVLLTLRCLTLSLVSLSSNGYAESSWYICIGLVHAWNRFRVYSWCIWGILSVFRCICFVFAAHVLPMYYTCISVYLKHVLMQLQYYKCNTCIRFVFGRIWITLRNTRKYISNTYLNTVFRVWV